MLWCHMHVWEHNNPEPENRTDSEKDVCHVYEDIFSHNTPLVTFIVTLNRGEGEDGQFALVRL